MPGKSVIMFSKACEYGIKATIYIAVQSAKSGRVSLTDIAREIDSPVAFTSKILQKLARKKLIDSYKGPHGGFEISPAKAAKLKLSQVVTTLDGSTVFTGCSLGFAQCNDSKPCPMHFRFKIIRDDLKRMLEETTLEELSDTTSKGQTFLKRK